MIAMRHGFVPAALAMRVTIGARRAGGRVLLRVLNSALVEVVPVQTVHAAVVEVVDMAVVANGGVSTSVAVDV